MTNMQQHPIDDVSSPLTIEGGEYVARRHCVMDGHGTGTVTLENADDGRLRARAAFDGVTGSMQIETVGGATPRALMDTLLALADDGLAYDPAALVELD